MLVNKHLSLVLLILFCLPLPEVWSNPVSGQDGLVDYVNILQGTDSSLQFSHGNTLPLVGMPWGMVDWSIQNGTGGWYFKPDGTIDGFRATRLPSPWLSDYGHFVLMPQSGDLRMDPQARKTIYDTNTAVLRPDYERLELKTEAITAELSGTERCGVFRLTFHEGKSGRLILNVPGKSEIKIKGRNIYGISRAIDRKNHSGIVADNFASYFVIKLDRDIIRSETFLRLETNAASPPAKPESKPSEARAFVEFNVTPSDPVLVKIGTSFISWKQAEQNLHSEEEGTFETIHERVAAVWNANLGKIEIDATEEQKNTFYSCLYRAQMFPHRLFEINAAGKQIHYSPYDGKIHDGVLYADIGIWDGFRTTFPLITLLYPSQLDEILQGFVNASQEGDGTLPEWPSPGYRLCMIGQHCAAIFADAIAKGRKGFDAAKAYESLRQSAFEPPTRGQMVREGMSYYLKLGYTPENIRYSVSTTLDYAYDDWCVAQMARMLKHPETADTLMARAQNYRKLWDSSVGFMRPKDVEGHWFGTFDEFAWGGPYAECGPWQASWFVPHDPAGLTELMGGNRLFAEKLDRLMGLPPVFHFGAYKKCVHEMAEMAALRLGQCSLNNQPSFNIPYLYAAIGQPWKTQFWTRRACAELFNSTPRGFCGDEDNGSLASWYILSSIGLYPFCPGDPAYLVTSPAFPKIIIHLPDKKTLLITSSGYSDTNVYIQKRLFNGVEDSKTWISHDDILRGGELHFEMGPVPNMNRITEEELPYSASKTK